MKYIIDTYGRFLLNGAIVTIVLLLLLTNIQDGEGNKGIFKIIGANLNVTSTDASGYTDFDIYLCESLKDMPDIRYEYDQKLYAGEDIHAADFIRSTDSAGNSLELRILKVLYEMGNEISSGYDGTSGNINFPTEGIYLIKVAAKDTANKKYTCAIKVPVNKK